MLLIRSVSFWPDTDESGAAALEAPLVREGATIVGAAAWEEPADAETGSTVGCA